MTATSTLFNHPMLPFGEPLELTPPKTQRVNLPDALFNAAERLSKTLENGNAFDAKLLRSTLTDATGASDASGGWVWKDAYDVIEVATLIHILQHHNPLPETPEDRLAWFERLQNRDLTHSKRSETQQRLQQYSTPLPYAYVAAQALSLQDGDRLLEPSAGTGVLAAVAVASGLLETLILNEIGSTRAALLAQLFPSLQVTSYNAENIHHYLPAAKPTVVLMNPPFSASPVRAKAYRRADLAHLRSAFALLPRGGRLVAITAQACLPSTPEWNASFEPFNDKDKGAARVVFTAAVSGNLYRKRGTTFDSRLTVIDRSNDPSVPICKAYRLETASGLLDAIHAHVPPRAKLAKDAKATRKPLVKRFKPHVIKTAAKPAPTATSKKPTLSLVSPEQTTTHRTNRAWDDPQPLAYTVTAPDQIRAPRETSGPYAIWEASSITIPDAYPHPSPLVQSLAMSAVPHPLPTYQPILPKAVRDHGQLSDAQLESVILAGEAHTKHLQTRCRVLSDYVRIQACAIDDNQDLPVTEDGLAWSSPVHFRQGWFLGDGTGTGKGRQVAAVMLDNWLRGNKKAIWLSQSDKLIEDARRDWSALGGVDQDIFPLSKFRQDDPIGINEGILFTTYATLRSPERQGRRSRLDQIIAWLAGSTDETDRHHFSGVIVFDEAHAMANAAGSKSERGDVAPSAQGRAGLRLQHALPDARVLYVSATGASTLTGLSYASRLGLWGGDDTPFESRDKFVATMENGGVAAMEVVARDLKALGLYQCRALAYDGIEIEPLIHDLTPAQQRIYDAYAQAFHVIHHNINAALKDTGATGIDPDTGTLKTFNKEAKRAAMQHFESTKQRFFNHLLNGMKCPSLLRAIENDLANNRSAVIQLVSTDEALLDRRIAQIPADEWDDLNIDMTPRDTILTYLQRSFPVQAQEIRTDADNNPYAEPAYDENGNPIISEEAVLRRDRMIEHLATLPPIPTALDQIIHYFGADHVAEITGRSRRILKLTDASGNHRLALRTRPTTANLKEADAFMNGDKRILVFSLAGATGRSYHADLSRPNTQRRVHYLLEAGWRADQAIQGLGRSHRTFQASVPLFRPVSTNVKGERRFISTIARRLNALGAITRGQRDAQTRFGDQQHRLFRESDNFDSLYAKIALRQLFRSLHRGAVDGWSMKSFQDATGLKLTDGNNELLNNLPPMSQVLNRLLALPIDSQNDIFAELEERLEANIEQAVAAGTYELGIETVRADSMTLVSNELLYEHPGAGANTQLLRFNRQRRIRVLSATEALEFGARHPHPDGDPWCVVNQQSGRAALVTPAPSRTEEDGSVTPQLRLVRPTSRDIIRIDHIRASNWQREPQPDWTHRWQHECATTPDTVTDQLWLASGLLLPVWDRFPEDTMRVRRIITDDDRTFIGRLLQQDHILVVRNAFGLNSDPHDVYTPDDVYTAIFNRSQSFQLANGWRLTRRSIQGEPRIELEGPTGDDTATPKRLGCQAELVNWHARLFVPRPDVLSRIIHRWPILVANSE